MYVKDGNKKLYVIRMRLTGRPEVGVSSVRYELSLQGVRDAIDW